MALDSLTDFLKVMAIMTGSALAIEMQKALWFEITSGTLWQWAMPSVIQCALAMPSVKP